MKSQKFILSMTTSICTLLLASTSTAYAADSAFQDTKGHWAEEAIQRMSNYEIVHGYQGQFRPDDSITRGEMAVILDGIMNYQQSANNQFTDLGEAFYTDAILRANHAGIMHGFDGLVRPNDPISREETVVMMASAFDVKGKGTPISSTDADQISKWAADSVSAFMERGYVNATGEFRPKASITRAEAVTILNRLLAGYYTTSGSYSDTADGTVVVNTPNVTLKEAVIDGDLILTEGILDGDVTLENVNVKGRTLIRGGGTNSIHVTGTSTLGQVIMEREGAGVRLSVEDNAKVGEVVMGEKAAQAIISGTVSNITTAGAGELVVQNGQVNTVSVASPNTTVTLTDKSAVKTIQVEKEAVNAKISVQENTSIDSVQIDAPNIQVLGKGTVHAVKANANNISVNTPDTKVTVAEGATGVTVDGQSATKGQSSHSGGGSSGGGGSNRPAKLNISRVESVENGLVRVTLNQATKEPLRKEQFSIICMGAGKNMTILNVYTKDNTVYDLTTAYYNDNTYQLGLKLDDGRLLTYNFVSKYDCPAITSVKATRTTVNNAELIYASDIAGTFYWMVQPNVQTVLRTVPEEPAAEDIMKNGNQQPMLLHSNTVQISDLVEHTPYTIYYVAKGTDEKVTPVKQVQIAAEPIETPPTSNITIEEATAHNNPDMTTTHEHVYFDIRLSEPTAEELTTAQFQMSCPADSDIPLGRLETSDKQNYRVYLEPRYMIKDNNHYTCTISFADGTQATKTFYVDLTGPDLTGTKITRLPNDKAKIEFTASEPGKIYYDVLTGKEFGYGDSGAKDPNIVIDSGKTHTIEAGLQSVEVDFSDKPVKQDLFFCYVAEDKLGNRSIFWYDAIPNQESTPDPTPESGKYKILSITGGQEDGVFPLATGHVLYLTMNEKDLSFYSDAVTITGDTIPTLNGSKALSVSTDSTQPTMHTVTLLNRTLAPGEYTIKINIDSETVTQTFIVNDDTNFSVTSK